jgi:UDP-N-acetyl-D-glucosamine dehydrogenase
MSKAELLKRLKNKDAMIGIIGLGYVGLPLSLRYAEVGYKVLGFDIDQNKVDMINSGKSYHGHIPDSRIAEETKGNLRATTDFALAAEVDALILCVPTPLDKYREPDLSYIVQTMESILPYVRGAQVVSLESTTYPGNTDEMLKPMLEAQGLTVGKDIFLIYSPEREDPGNPEYGTSNIPKVCGGCTPDCLEIGVALYEQVVIKVVPVSSTRVAEMTKLLENIHRAVNIGLMNEMKVLADKMQIDLFEVIGAAASKPFGFVPYYPGPGIGGHCIPIDPFYLTWKAREYGMHTRFIELAGEINSNMPKWVVNKTADALNDQRKSLKGSKILLLGMAYKCDVEDLRESPSLFILEQLVAKGAEVSYSDPHIPTLTNLRGHHFDGERDSVELTPQSLASFDCVIVCTAHSRFDFELIKKHAALIIDTRGIYRQLEPHIVRG